MKIKLVFFFLSCYSLISAQKTDFSKSIITLPNNLTNNANFIVRSKSTNVNITSKKNMIVEYNMFITVLQNEADDIIGEVMNSTLRNSLGITEDAVTFTNAQLDIIIKLK